MKTYNSLRLILAFTLLALAPASRAATLAVTSTDDSGAGTLRSAVAGANSGDTIVFDSSLSGQTILLTSGQIVLSQNVTIDGSTLANGISINGNYNSRVFSVTNATVLLDSLTLTNGYGSGAYPANNGGAIANRAGGDLILNRCTLVGNTSAGSGGGIFSDVGSTLNLWQCTLAGNSAINSGAIDNYGALTVLQSTITGNSATASGGGIYNLTTLNMTNSIVAGNTPNNIAANAPIGDNNLTNGTPQLAPLGNYGGPTPTMPPLPGSPAIDAGDDSVTNFLTTDQRGYPRLVGAHVDIGAVEVQATPWPDATDLGNGWRKSSWFGIFNVNSFPWIYHAQHGWLYVFGTDPTSIWMWTPDTVVPWTGFVWTGSGVYPWLWSDSQQTWLYYDVGSSNPRWFYNWNEQKWTNVNP